MSVPSEDPFEGKAEFFAGHYRGTRGRVRLELVLARLLRYLPEPPARILDAGGGTGAFAIPLAEHGYELTVLDPSEEWLGRAKRHASEAGVRVGLVRGTADDAPALTSGTFDAVLCHTVLIYTEDPARTLAALREVAAPGAVLSSLEKNRDALPVRPAREGDFGEALRVMDDPVASGRLGIPNRALAIGELRQAMVRSGWLPERWAGIRVFTDGAPEDLDPATFETLLGLDRAASTREPHRRFGRLLHVLARAWEPEPFGQVQARSFAKAGPGTRESWPEDRALGPEGLDAFLDRKRYAALSTTRPDGRPHSTMVAFVVRDGRIWLPTIATGQRLKNLAAEPAASLLVSEGEGDDHVMVMIEGQAALRDAGPLRDAWLREAWRARHGSDVAWAEAVIELIPTKILSYAGKNAPNSDPSS